MSSTDISAEDKEFLAECEEEFKDRYTENDKEFMKVFKSEPSNPPVIENWWVPQNYGGARNERRQNRRFHPHERNNRNNDRNRRGYNYNDDNERGQGNRNYRPY